MYVLGFKGTDLDGDIKHGPLLVVPMTKGVAASLLAHFEDTEVPRGREHTSAETLDIRVYRRSTDTSSWPSDLARTFTHVARGGTSPPARLEGELPLTDDVETLGEVELLRVHTGSALRWHLRQGSLYEYDTAAIQPWELAENLTLATSDAEIEEAMPYLLRHAPRTALRFIEHGIRRGNLVRRLEGRPSSALSAQLLSHPDREVREKAMRVLGEAAPRQRTRRSRFR